MEPVGNESVRLWKRHTGDRHVLRSPPAAEFEDFLGVNADLMESGFDLFFG